MAKRKIPRMCITCEHYTGSDFKCNKKNCYISYDYAFEERNGCKQWKLNHNYKKGGKFYNESISQPNRRF